MAKRRKGKKRKAKKTGKVRVKSHMRKVRGKKTKIRVKGHLRKRPRR